MKRHRRHRFRRVQAGRPSGPRPEAPPELQIGQVERLAEALPEGIEDPGFELLLRRIDGAPFFGGNEVTVYFEGRSAFGCHARRGAGGPARGPARVLHLQGRLHRPPVPHRDRGRGQARDQGAGARRRRRLLRDQRRVLGRDGEPRHRGLPLPPAVQEPLVPAVPGPSQDPGRRPRGGLHRRHEHRRGVRLLAPPAQSPGRPGGTPTCGSRGRRPGRWRWSSPRGGSTPAARRSRSIRCRPRPPRRRECGRSSSTRGRSAGRRSPRR